MSWFGKILGGALGFALGGPLGALVGVALGHNIDRAARSSRDRGWIDSDLLDSSDSDEYLDSPNFSTRANGPRPRSSPPRSR